MQKLAGIITEGQYKEKLKETDSNLGNLLTPSGLHTFLHNLRNLINGGNKKKQLDMVNNAISSIADKLNEMEGNKGYGIEKDSSPYDFGPYTYEEAKAEAARLTAKNPRNVFQPKPLSNMEDDLPAIDRMGMPGRSSRGVSSGDLGDY